MKKHCDQVISGACCLERPLTVKTFGYNVARILALTEPELAALSDFNINLVVGWVDGMIRIGEALRCIPAGDLPAVRELAQARVDRVRNARENVRVGRCRCSGAGEACTPCLSALVHCCPPASLPCS